MAKTRIKYFLDFIPVLILVFYALKLTWILSTEDFQINWLNIEGFILLPVTIFLLVWRHAIGVLALGLLLFLGLFGVLSFSTGIASFGMGIGKNGSTASFNMHGDPVYIVFLLIHFTISFRYYVGILTKKYWQQLFSVPAGPLEES